MFFCDYEMTPFYISGSVGRLFILECSPTKTLKSKQAILHIPAFADELNKSRRMVSLQSKELAKQGHTIIVVDLFGTGDSEGDFLEARWEIWKTDILIVCKWLVDRGAESICLWGLRLGALLAMDFIADGTFRVCKLLCWQPVLSGEVFLMQFLRLRTVASLMTKNIQKEKNSDLKQQLIDGQTIEVAGYMLNSYLANSIMALKVDKMELKLIDQLVFFEIVSSEEKLISFANQKMIDTQKSQGIDVVIRKVVGSPFWATQEISEVPELITDTTNCWQLENRIEK